jgi:DnaJ-class molecular chaperone
MAKSFYESLEVSESASPDEIKKQFRKLAKKHHPDRNKGSAEAEARFKEISEAYETLSDPKKKEEYDTMRRYGAYAEKGAGPFSGQEFDFSQFGRRGGRTTIHVNEFGDGAGWDEILSSFFAGGDPTHQSDRMRRHTPEPQRGRDMEAELTVTFMEAVHGARRMIAVNGKRLSVRIPAGIDEGGRIRLAGQGYPNLHGGENGDLLITVHVTPDGQFTRKGNDIYSSVEITFIDAIKGTRTSVKTLTGTVTLTIPAGTQPGAKLRLKGQGLRVSGATGDHYVEVKVTIPKSLTEKQRKMVEEWEG